MNETYARGDTYAGDEAYARDDDAFARDGAYSRDDTYGGGQRKPRRDAYAREQTYARRQTRTRGAGKERTGAAGGFILVFVALFCTCVLIAALVYAQGIGERRKVLMAQGDCAPVPSLSPTGLDCTTEQQLAGQYTKMIDPMIQQLNTDVAAYAAAEFRNLGAAKAALTAQVALATSLSTSLAQFPFPAFIAPAAKKLIQDNDALVKLKAEQARSSSLGQLRSFNDRVDVASAAVRADLQVVIKDLDKPPTANEEP